ncbi:MAG TPA: UPF0182 family protein [Vicinamibacterales bacterium]|jgi:hypothetical protein|nr:UPF0182 family protein [Vicinamibacterales bacterium]
MPRSSRVVGVAAFVLLALAMPQIVRYYTDWLWFGEVGFQQVFSTILRTQSLLFVGALVISVAWFALNVRIAVATMGDRRPTFVTREGLEVQLPGREQVQRLALAGMTVVAVLIGLYAAAEWPLWLTFRNGGSFGQADPILGFDVGFYVFALPFWQVLRGIGQVLVILAALVAGGLYLVSGSLASGFGRRLSMTRAVRLHLSSLAAVFFLLLGVGAWLNRAEHLLEPTTLLFGASYADVMGRMPASLLLAAVCVVGAVLAMVQAYTPRNWPIPAAVGLYLLVSVGGELYSSAMQRFVVAPNEQTRESPYIQHNIDATRRAFGLDGVEERELSGDALLTSADIGRNAATLDNVRLWDHQPLLETFGQIQEIRTYYEFGSVDNDRYRVGGQLRQVMLSARELNSASLPNRTWVNERLTFTHGYGLTLGPVNQVTGEGLPVLFVRDLPPVTSPPFTIDEPSLYYGEFSSDYVIVKTKTREFHYPRGDDNVFKEYAGKGGVPLSSFWRKLLFAFRFGAYQIVLNDGITPESRILFNRAIGERVRAIAPFLEFDRDPYLVLADGRLFWISDAYTTSTRYPYSAPVNGRVNYIRNAVKFVIDAYDGTTTAYLADTRDPIAAAYGRAFPGLFVSMDTMPAAIREHVRYPEDIFGLQARVFATYHMTQPAVFYNREDQWEVPTIDEGRDARPMQPYYTIMRLPGERDAEFIQMLPYTPRRRDNLAAWLVARSDGEHYGKLRVFEFPKQKLVFGPRQVVGRILQDQTISPQITLWNQQGSAVIWGTLMVIPVEESLIYVRPLYLKASGGRIPELTRVIVAYQNQIVMEDTLEEGLARIFGARGAAPAPATTPPAGTQTSAPTPAPQTAGAAPTAGGNDALAAEARTHYDRAIAAQRAGDWAKYGEEIRALGGVLERMRRP